MARLITEEEKQAAHELVERARAAMKCIEDYDQARVDRLCQAVGGRPPTRKRSPAWPT